MFGIKKTEELEQRINDHHAALQRIARHVGVVGHQMSPDRLATAICSGIDALLGKEPQKASAPGSESRPIAANIRKIKLSGATDVIVTQGAEPKMVVFANDAADLPKILTSVSGDCLTVDNEPMMIVAGNRISTFQGSMQIVMGGVNVMERRTDSSCFRVEVTLPNVNSLRISGAGNAIYHDIEQDELRLDVTGAGAIDVAGKVNRLDAEVSGAGSIAAYMLAASHGHLRVSGAGSIKATAAESVVARVSGVGKIKIAGNPPQRDTEVSGLGKIKFVESM